MNKSESKYFNTAIRMDEALISLLETKDLAYITIKEICEKAQVNRSTFYLHYETIGDLVNEAMDRVEQRFQSYFQHSEHDLLDKINGNALKELVLITQDYLQPYLRFIRDHKRVYRAAFRNPDNMRANMRYDYLKRHILEPILNKFHVPDTFRQYYIAYYIEGVMAIIKVWLENDCTDPMETIATIIEECVKPFGGTEENAYGV